MDDDASSGAIVRMRAICRVRESVNDESVEEEEKECDELNDLRMINCPLIAKEKEIRI